MNVADSAPPLAKWVNHPYAIDRSANVPVRGTEPVMDERHAAMTRAYELAADFLDTLHDRPVWPRATYQEMLEARGGQLSAEGLEHLLVRGPRPDRTIVQCVEKVGSQLIGPGHRRVPLIHDRLRSSHRDVGAAVNGIWVIHPFSQWRGTVCNVHFGSARRSRCPVSAAGAWSASAERGRWTGSPRPW